MPDQEQPDPSADRQVCALPRCPARHLSYASAMAGEGASGLRVFMSYRREDRWESLAGSGMACPRVRCGSGVLRRRHDSVGCGLSSAHRPDGGGCDVLLVLSAASGWTSPMSGVAERWISPGTSCGWRWRRPAPGDSGGSGVRCWCVDPLGEGIARSFASLAFRNGIQVRYDPDFHPDMDRLIRGLASHEPAGPAGAGHPPAARRVRLRGPSSPAAGAGAARRHRAKSVAARQRHFASGHTDACACVRWRRMAPGSCPPPPTRR